MPQADDPKRGFSLSRWSRRKLEAARATERTVAPATSAPPAVVTPAAELPSPQDAATQSPPLELPAIDSLTFESDFAAFLQPRVDESLRRQALKKLFADPRFNVMDGLDVYIDDYGKADPIDAETVRQLVQARYLFDPPRTRVNAQGVVEEIPPDADLANAVENADSVDGACSAPPSVPAPDPAADARDSLPGTPTASAMPLTTTREP
jgi:hypothetical protein